MIMISKDQLDIVRQYFVKRPDIAAVYLFGSFAEGVASPLSDLDLAILFSPLVSTNSYSQEKLNITALLSRLITAPVNIHILDTKMSLPFLFQVITKGKVQIDNMPSFRLDFEEKARNLYFDFQPVINQYMSALKQRLTENTYGNR